jgi:hypothetical protein
MARGTQEAQTAAEAVELREQVDRLTAELEEARGAVAAAAKSGGSGETEGDRLAVALEGITALLAAQQQAVADKAPTFKTGESAVDVYKSLEGTVLPGSVDENGDPVEHSGRKLPRPVTFKSKGKNQTIIRKGRHRFTDISGDVQVTTGVHYSFAPNGEFSTDDEEVVEFLKRKPEFDVLFWLEGAEPDRTPDAGPVVDRVIQAVIDLDVAALDEVEHEERAGYAREAVLVAVDRARRQITLLDVPGADA